MSKELAIYQNFGEIQQAAGALYKSGYFQDAKSEAQALVKVMAGTELGLTPFVSMSGIHIIQNKPVLGANIMATLVKNDPRYDYKIKQCDNAACVLIWFEDGVKVGEAGFTIQEAQAAGLTTKDNWKKYTSDMSTSALWPVLNGKGQFPLVRRLQGTMGDIVSIKRSFTGNLPDLFVHPVPRPPTGVSQAC